MRVWKAWLLWASVKLDGLLTKEEREQTLDELLALQKPDGGWSLPSLGYWQGKDPKHVVDKNGPSCRGEPSSRSGFPKLFL
jgi:hypothetical protein